MSSDPLLHIKDSYYFDVPRMFWRANYADAESMADGVGEWVVRNDSDYQDWEADRFIEKLNDIFNEDLPADQLKAKWRDWQHADPHRHGRPFDQYIEDSLLELDGRASAWAKTQSEQRSDTTQWYLSEFPDAYLLRMHNLRTIPEYAKLWGNARRDMDDRQVLDAYLDSPRADWAEQKTHEINHHLSGKVFIPQPFATLKNAYEVQSGFGISKYMLIEVAVAILLLFAFRWLAGKIRNGDAPRGKMANLLEGLLVFIKTEVVEKGIDPHDSKRFMPLMWTIFLFILGCNLTGLLPWVGSPTAAFGVTVFLALVIFAVGTVLGVKKFGVVGYLKSLCPHLGLPLYIGIFIVPIIWFIEFVSLFIKHTILAIRLLSNMVGGHMALLGVMGLAFGHEAIEMGSGAWSALAFASVIGTTLLSMLELFVAFLQAYVFTLLASLFIGSATHGH